MFVLRCRGKDRPEHSVRIAKHIIVPEPKHAIACITQPTIPLTVSVSVVLPTIHFDNDTAFMTNEISYVVPDRHLPTKFQTFQL